MVVLLLLYLAATAFFLLFIQHASGGHGAARRGSVRSPLLLRRAQMRPEMVARAPSVSKWRGRPLVLFWTPLWNRFENWERFFSVPRLGRCRARCAFSHEERYLDAATLVLFSAADVHRMPPPEQYQRPAEQLWGLLALDPPPATRRTLDLRQYDRCFNWTLSYRRDADVPLRYGRTVKLARPRPPPAAAAADTDRRALFRPQLCLTASRREQYVHQLQRHMPVDVLGPCAGVDCGAYKPCFMAPAAANASCDIASECFSRLSSNYSFYLALEQVHCRDFVSARLHQALRHQLVPVVRGGADYSHLAPPGSYIDAAQFDGPEALAQHLRTMSEKELRGYHRWRRTHEVQANNWACELCTRLHGLSGSRTLYPAHTGRDLHSWWYERGQCERRVPIPPPPA